MGNYKDVAEFRENPSTERQRCFVLLDYSNNELVRLSSTSRDVHGIQRAREVSFDWTAED